MAKRSDGKSRVGATANGRVHVIDHPLVAHMLTEARDRKTRPDRFRRLLAQIGALLAYEVTRDVQLDLVAIDTPMEKLRACRLRLPITVVPILRAGLGMAEGILDLIPEAHAGHIGMFRDEKRLQPVSYYEKLPLSIAKGPVILVDPMLATGGSALAAVQLLKTRGCTDIRYLCLIASPEGVAKLTGEFPTLPIYTAAIDRELDERGYILPGLGDAGDRLYGTTD
ncbi:MAG: uracil phosphoribosyltransferase [Phycisphaeraceae bacterium]